MSLLLYDIESGDKSWHEGPLCSDMDLFVFYLSHIKSFLSNELDIYVNPEKTCQQKYII